MAGYWNPGGGNTVGSHTRKLFSVGAVAALSLLVGVIAAPDTAALAAGSATVSGGAIGNRVWADSNANGLYDSGEPGLGGVKVTLSNEAGVARYIGTTSLNGWWGFRNLPVGRCYRLSFQIPDGYAASPIVAGGNTADSAGVVPDRVCVTAATQNQWDMGLVSSVGPDPEPVGRIGNRVFNDLDNDGVAEANEAGVGDVQIQLRAQDGTPLLTGETAPGGWYGFEGLATDRCYIIAITAPDGFQPTVKQRRAYNNYNPGLDSDANPNGATDPICLTDAAPSDDTRDIGLTTSTLDQTTPPHIKVTYTLWEDVNRNGERDPDEPPTPRFEIFAFGFDSTLTQPINADGTATLEWDYLDWGNPAAACNTIQLQPREPRLGTISVLSPPDLFDASDVGPPYSSGKSLTLCLGDTPPVLGVGFRQVRPGETLELNIDFGLADFPN